MQNFNSLSDVNSESGEPTDSDIFGRNPGNVAGAATPGGLNSKQTRNAEENNAQTSKTLVRSSSETDASGARTKIVGSTTAEPSQRTRLLTWTMECKQWQKQRAFAQDEGSTFEKYQITHQTFRRNGEWDTESRAACHGDETHMKSLATSNASASSRAFASGFTTPRIGAGPHNASKEQQAHRNVHPTACQDQTNKVKVKTKTRSRR